MEGKLISFCTLLWNIWLYCLKLFTSELNYLKLFIMQIGVRYGSLVEDYFTGYQLQCEGWKAIFCNPARAAFYGDAPINLVDVINQTKRWTIGLLEVTFSKYSPITFGIRAMGPIMGLSYAHYSFWPIWSIPITVYAFLPQLALLSGITIFPKVKYFHLWPRFLFHGNVLHIF